jgi:hypothetical protein
MQAATKTMRMVSQLSSRRVRVQQKLRVPETAYHFASALCGTDAALSMKKGADRKPTPGPAIILQAGL